MKTLRLIVLSAACLLAGATMYAADLELPQSVTAGTGFSISTAGEGDATFYLIGPATVVKRRVQLGSGISVSPAEVEKAGRYLVILRSARLNRAGSFWVTPSQPRDISFLARPSRVPVAMSDVISGVAYVFDDHQNLVMAPVPVKFDLAVSGAPRQSRTVTTKYGVAWTRTDSTQKEGAAQFTASVGDLSVRRIVQMVASDPCNLRIEAKRVKDGIEVTTAPIRDCSGNPVPDGTVVTFTAMTPKGKSTVDAHIKKGVATADFPHTENALISAASGVVLGNEVRVGGAR